MDLAKLLSDILNGEEEKAEKDEDQDEEED